LLPPRIGDIILSKRRAFFDSIASVWDERFYCIAKDQKNLDRHCALFDIKKGYKILDIGCGTGVMFGRLKKLAGKRGRVIGIDFSPAMIKRAKNKHKNDKKNFIYADAHYLPFEGKTFDRVICFSCFPHFSDKKKAIKEAVRVLKPKGMLVISHLCSSRKVSAIHKCAGAPVSKDFLPRKSDILSYIKHAGMKLVDFRDQKDLYLVKMQRAFYR
jgi:demethylmenaquinone methyltransferase/2-methoxy-6-polyprenyl-1,4-benzoquinol methylase